MEKYKLKMWAGDKEVFSCEFKGEIKHEGTIVSIDEDSVYLHFDKTKGDNAIIDLLTFLIELINEQVYEQNEEGEGDVG